MSPSGDDDEDGTDISPRSESDGPPADDRPPAARDNSTDPDAGGDEPASTDGASGPPPSGGSSSQDPADRPPSAGPDPRTFESDTDPRTPGSDTDPGTGSSDRGVRPPTGDPAGRTPGYHDGSRAQSSGEDPLSEDARRAEEGADAHGSWDDNRVDAHGSWDDNRADARGSRDDGSESDSVGWKTFVYDLVSSAVAVVLVGALLFAVSGVWPPLVAVESPSMTPHVKTGDLVFVMEEERFPGDGAHPSGVVTARTGETTSADYRKFQRQGDVIVYEPNGNGGQTPIIHRAMFWVEEGENWYDKADRQAVGRYSECGDTVDEALPNCPAPNAGFITKGDANGVYDQVRGLSDPVKPEWVVGTAELRIPKLGCVRLRSRACSNLLFGQSTLGQPGPFGQSGVETVFGGSTAGFAPLAGSASGRPPSTAAVEPAAGNATAGP